MNRREFNLLAATSALALGGVLQARADETCQSPYMPKITGQEEYVYVWTLGKEGMGDEHRAAYEYLHENAMRISKLKHLHAERAARGLGQ